ncbi:MAG TPA: hypothetical protein VLJ10_01840, partial [Candidatus Bathyarchaeia archaeon]|nr:hypothetical protein [Candidatus Bathyarchaeia archaeon]
LSIGLVGMLRVFSMALQAQSRIDDYQDAALLADSKMSELMMQRYASPGSSAGVFEEPFSGTRYHLDVEPNQENPALQEVSLTLLLGGAASGVSFDVKTLLFAPPASTEEEN